MPPSPTDIYRSRAKECLEHCDAALPDNKAKWVGMAERWGRLAQTVEENDRVFAELAAQRLTTALPPWAPTSASQEAA